MLFLPIVMIFTPIFAALIIYIFKNRYINVIALVAQLAVTILLVIYYNAFKDDFASTYFVIGNWQSRIGISLVNDTFSISFMFLTVFSWWMVLIYTFDKRNTDPNFLFFLMFLEGVFMGLLMTNDLFNMFVFIELTTILVTILIAFKKAGESFRAGIYYLLLNTSGVLLFLIGIILVYNTFGTINIMVIHDNMATFKDRTAIHFAYVLMMAGISVKAALFPVFTWLPKAHGVAQSAISALLSGLIVKGGLYLFIRINWMFSPAEIPYHDFFFVIGAATAVIGVMFALSQKDIKQILAYHTISQVGIVMMGLSSAPDTGIFYGGLYHIFNHALFKSLLFLGAGVIINAYRTKKVKEIRGVMKTMPFVSLFMIVGMLSITGAPFFNGFISKSIIKYGMYDSDFKYWTLFIVNVGTATSFLKMSQIFFGPRPMTIRIKSIQQRIALMTLAFTCVLLGTFYIPISNGFFGIDLSYINIYTPEPFYDYIAAVTIGFCFYKLAIEGDGKLVRGIRDFKVSFETANYLFIVYIIVMVSLFVIPI